MATYPTAPRTAFLEWCEVHESAFIDHAAEIGLTESQALAFKDATVEGGARLLNQEQAKVDAKVATQKVCVAFKDLRNAAGDAVRTIRAFAETSEDPDAVYAIAKIPPLQPPSPLPPPGQPTNLTVLLDSTTGTITLAWKVSNPIGSSGTAYLVRRRLPGETEFEFLGLSGKKTFEDMTLIAGPDSVQYTVQGQRGDLSGPISPIFVVNFGRLPGGGRSASVATLENNSAALNVEIPAPVSVTHVPVTTR